MQKLNFPNYKFKFQKYQNKVRIFSTIRKKYVTLTPEEWVRQNCVQFLLDHNNCSLSLMNEEKKIDYNGLSKRYDVVVYKSNAKIQLIVECKSPTILINQKSFDQIARYNLMLDAEYLMLTNGLNHYYCKMDYHKQSYIYLKDLPKL